MSNPCDALPDPMDGATIPEGFDAVSTVVNGQVVWSTNPPAPPTSDREFLNLQSGGRLLIDEGVALAI